MPLVFLVPLAISLTTAWVSMNTENTLAELTGAATVLSLGISLVLAPWQVKALLLIVIFTTTKSLLRISRPAQTSGCKASSDLEERSQSQEVLQYRGVGYQPGSTSPANSGNSTLEHNAENADTHHFDSPSDSQEPLKYRGISIPAENRDE